MMDVLILTEGGKNAGFGHITRCTSIYQAFEEVGIRPEFIVNGDETILGFVKDKNCRISDWLSDREPLFALVRDSDIVFIDSYLAGYDLYEAVYKRAKIVAYLDDTKRIDYPPGVVLNGDICAEEMCYPEKDGTDYLLGSSFAPLRRVFWAVPPKVIRNQISDVLITFGGVFRDVFVKRLLGFLLRRFADFTYHLVLPPQRPEDCNAMLDAGVRMYSNLREFEMCELMLKCDICISGGGQTTYELTRVGVPTIGICFAENQRLNLEGWRDKGVIEYSGWYDDEDLLEKIAGAVEKLVSYGERIKRSKIGGKLVDGHGAHRIVDFLMREALC
jgi:spore coat polysaccharide biosynthesis predicted glycosyltransferase SpsG